jgi:hypothetical protein
MVAAKADTREWVMRKMNPNSPKKASAIAPLAAENRAFANSRTSSIGVGPADLPAGEPGQDRGRPGEAGQRRR